MRQPVEGALTLETRNPVGIDADAAAVAEPPGGDGCATGGAVETAATDSGEPLKGRVKWFDAGKGYGFVVADDGGADILVHYNLLAPLGCKTLPEGAEIVLQAREGARGRHGTRILHIDFHGCVARQVAPPPRPRRRLDSGGNPEDFEQVEVCWFNRARGYGFLLRDDGATQIFIHMETVRDGGMDGLHPGQQLLARIVEGPRGPFAAAVLP